jgi:hypothetical protein
LFGERGYLTGSQDLDDDHWALFNLDEDFAEATDLSAAEPARLRQLQDLWWAEAGRNQVLPLWEGPASKASIHPGEYPAPVQASYRPGGCGICEAQLPHLLGGFTATADIEVAGDRSAEGVICALGDLNGGWSWYLLDGRLVSCLVSFGVATRVASPDRVPPGRRVVGLRYQPSLSGPATLSLLIDGTQVATAEHDAPALFPALSTAGARLRVGRDGGLPFNDDYEPPFACTATLHTVTISSARPEDTRPTDERVDLAARAD